MLDFGRHVTLRACSVSLSMRLWVMHLASFPGSVHVDSQFGLDWLSEIDAIVEMIQAMLCCFAAGSCSRVIFSVIYAHWQEMRLWNTSSTTRKFQLLLCRIRSLI